MSATDATRYREDALRKQWRRFALISGGLGLLLVPAGISLDYMVYPQHFTEFLWLRMACDALIGAVLALFAFDFGRRHVKGLTLLWLAAVQLMIAYMIFRTEGGSSSYYAGLNLAMLAAGIVLPTSRLEAGLFALFTLATYLLATLVAGLAQTRPEVLFNNLYFLILTATIAVVANHFIRETRLRELRLSGELAQKNTELAELDRLKSDFFANVSHELRTPLTLILAPVQDLLQRRDPLPAEVAHSLDTVYGNAQRLLRLVNDLLDVIRLEEGKLELCLEPLRLGRLLAAACDASGRLALSREVRLYQQTQPTVVQADRHALEKVVFNLLSNALKFTEPGDDVVVSCEPRGRSAVLSVRDTGCGIPARDLPFVFDRFRQADGSSTRRHAGTGLGLALVKELTEKHGGSVTISSRAGEGTEVRISLPLCAAPPVADEPVAAPSAPAALEPPPPIMPLLIADAPRVLVVDDEPDMRRYLLDALGKDYALLWAADGREALRVAAQEQPDLIVLDLMLPQLDGLEVCRLLKQNPATRSIQIVLLTARVDEHARLTALTHGADDFLTKPFSSVELRTRLGNLLRSKALERELAARNRALENSLAELKAAEGRLIQSEKMNALGMLSAGLLHEINNPLNFALTALQLARNDPTVLSQPELGEVLADIDEGMHRIRIIVSDLRVFAHGGRSYASRFELAAAVRTALHLTAHECRGIEVEQALPAEADVLGSQPQVIQVLVNLLTNAAKAIAVAGRPGVVRIAAQARAGRLRVSVRDNGAGIEPAALSRVFDPFYTTRDVGEGMGLGLSICHTIVANHGGELRVASEPGKWTEFSFDLALADAEPAAPAALETVT